jgi:hypothetical protein
MMLSQQWWPLANCGILLTSQIHSSPAAVIVGSLEGEGVPVQPETELFCIGIRAACCDWCKGHDQASGQSSCHGSIAAHQLLEPAVVALKDQKLAQA